MPARKLRVNGGARRVTSAGERPLLFVLRDELDLTGAKYGCGAGQCGACTVLVDGKAMRSCQMPLEQAATAAITTVEGLEQKGRLHPLQQAFLDEEALQCGYCTPGMIMAAAGLLATNPDPSEDEVKRALAANVCRCGTYPRIVSAVRRAATAIRSAR
jgi:aerobic-type carbon monoxide dehydrogenase small subunit (CoxS/CutS family)